MPHTKGQHNAAQAAALERFELQPGVFPYSPLYGHLCPETAPVPAQPRSVRLCPAGRAMREAVQRRRLLDPGLSGSDNLQSFTAQAKTLALLDDDLRLRLQPLLCRSWRCESCRAYVARQDSARIEQALAQRDGACCVGVFTFRREGASAVRSRYESYDAVGERLTRFLRLLRDDGIQLEYCATVEQHANGYAHVNVVFANSELDALALDERTVQPKRGKPYRTSPALVRHLRPYLNRAGFGLCSLSRVRSAGAAAEYLAKTETRNVDACANELSKSSQVPTWAPKGYRRLRSSIGFLPERTSRTVGCRLSMPPDTAQVELDAGRLSHVEAQLRTRYGEKARALELPDTSRKHRACPSAAEGATVAPAAHERQPANGCPTPFFPPYPAPAPRKGGRVGGTPPDELREPVPAGGHSRAAAGGRSALSSKGTSQRKRAPNNGRGVTREVPCLCPEQREGHPPYA